MVPSLTAKSRYYVVLDRDGWKIQCEGENSEPYATRREAFKDAVALAHLDERNGREAEVVVQHYDGFLPRWCSTRDTYPPPLVPDL